MAIVTQIWTGETEQKNKKCFKRYRTNGGQKSGDVSATEGTNRVKRVFVRVGTVPKRSSNINAQEGKKYLLRREVALLLLARTRGGCGMGSAANPKDTSAPRLFVRLRTKSSTLLALAIPSTCGLCLRSLRFA